VLLNSKPIGTADGHGQGLPGTITLKNGEKYSGVLSGTSLDPSELRYVFKMVKKLMPASNAQTNGTGDVSDDYVGAGDYHVMSFDMSDVADFNVNNVVLDKSSVKGQNGICPQNNAVLHQTDHCRNLGLPHGYRHFGQNGFPRARSSKMGAV
jgi:hypothetical protein